jgi:hypothetical protein
MDGNVTLSGIRILVIDDDPIARQAMQEMLNL